MAEDIEAKIRRLRELGRMTAESESPEPEAPPKPSSSKKPIRRPRSLSSIRQKERRKRVLIGASVLIITILLISAGIYSYLQSSKASKIRNARSEKIRELNHYFNSYNFSNPKCSPKALRYRDLAMAKIASAKSLDEINEINVKAYFDKAVAAYEQCIEAVEKAEYGKRLNQTKQEKIQEIEMAFQPLLSLNLPDTLRTKAVATMKSLEEQVQSATTIEQVTSVKPDDYLLSLWREYYEMELENIPGQEVILEKNGTKAMVSKDDAKKILFSVEDYKELMGYKISPVEWVEISLVLQRKDMNGALFNPGDRIKLYIGKNATMVDGYFELMLLPIREGGSISVSESQSQSSSTSTSSSTSYSESHSSSESTGSASLSGGNSASDSYSNSQSGSQSSSASYSYSVNLAEILKAIAAGKIQASDEVKAQLKNYGWKLLDLEKSTELQSMPDNTEIMVIVKVPSIFVPDILKNQNSITIARVIT